MSGRPPTLLGCSVIGAAHQRQGKPCQDASLARTLRAHGQELHLLVVADGHGGSRYWLSEVGSRIACDQAEQAVRQALQHTPLADERGWLELLQRQLPARIHAAWWAAIEADWRQRREAAEQPFSPLSYGCTLGLVLLSPHWWGCCGIGDWDLAGVDPTGQAQLLSEEDSNIASGEATGSLCQPLEEQAWLQRAQLQRLGHDSSLQALVLSSDGVRKSCATDHDYLQLCSGLLELQSLEALAEGLGQITSQGSGDDVSVVIARCGPARSLRRKQRLGWWLLPPLAALCAGAVLLGWQRLQRPDPLSQLVDELCRTPARIRPSLSQRRSQFQLLLQQPQLAEALQQQASTDPLGALIASSASDPRLGCSALQHDLQWQWQQAGKMPAAAPSPP